MKRLLAIPMLAAVTALGIASAAQLGGVTGLTTPNIASADTVVAACDTDGVAISYVTDFPAPVGPYKVTKVNVGVTGSAATELSTACNGKKLELKLTTAAGGGSVLSTDNVLSISVSSGVQQVTLATPQLVSAIDDLHILITD